MSYFDELISKVSFEKGYEVPAPAAGNTPPLPPAQTTVNTEEAEAVQYDGTSPYLDMYMKNVSKPTAPDENKNKKNVRAASIAQALGILADAFGASQGAMVQKRGDNPVGTVVGEQKRLRDVYEQKLDRYNHGLMQSQMQDVGLKRAEKNKQEAKAEAENQEKKEEERYQRRRGESLEDAQVRADIEAGKQLYVAKNKPRDPKEAKETKYNAAQIVEIQKGFSKIPIDFLKRSGYTKTIKVKKPDPTRYGKIIEVDEVVPIDINDPAIKHALILQWDQENQAGAGGAPPPPPPPARPAWSTNATKQTQNNNSRDPLGLGI